ncbi:MAG TPA: universal stress protein [Cellulomonas sp.]|nr:universal stress protein [Cellulomonas sp.]
MRTYGPIVIALDGSLRSPQTLEWGLAAAERERAEVVLARAYRAPNDYQTWGWYVEVGDRAFELDAKEYLAELLDRESARHPALDISTALLHGPAVPELRALSADARLLVIGAGGRAGDLGRTAAHLAAHALCPVAVVRPVSDTSDASVVVGIDGSRASLDAADVAAREAALRASRLVLLHARPTIADPFGDVTATSPPGTTVDERTQLALDAVAGALRAEHPGVPVEPVIVDDDPAHALVHAARGAALVVVGSRGLGAFRGMLLGSVSNQVARHAPCPVIVLHDGTAAA